MSDMPPRLVEIARETTPEELAEVRRHVDRCLVALKQVYGIVEGVNEGPVKVADSLRDELQAAFIDGREVIKDTPRLLLAAAYEALYGGEAELFGQSATCASGAVLNAAARVVRAIDNGGGTFGSLDELEDHETAVNRERQLASEAFLRAVESPAVVYRGDGLYETSSGPLRLESSEEMVLESLVEQKAATKDQLAKHSGVDEPQKVLKTIRDKFPGLADAIILPGGKGKGGYRTTILDGRD